MPFDPGQPPHPATLSADQARAWEKIAEALETQGIGLVEGRTGQAPAERAAPLVLAVTGKAGSGKTRLLATLCSALRQAGVEIVTGDWEGRRRRERRSLAVLAPTNKAASVLRAQGVPATTIHRILYTPLYDPQYEKIAEWLAGQGKRPAAGGLGDEALDRAQAFYTRIASVPGALAAAGLRGSDFIRGWKRREDPLDIGLVDEASMLDDRQFEDLQRIFPCLILFGDPAQLPPVEKADAMVFDSLAPASVLRLSRIHRQEAGSPILDLAHALASESLDFNAFEQLVHQASLRDCRVVWAERVDADLMARSPVLVWRNETRIRLITAFRTAHGAPDDALVGGEPLICDGLELPLKQRRRRIELEARGLIKGAQVVYLGPGARPGYARLHLMGADDPRLSVASIVRIERPGTEGPMIAHAATMGASFLHGAAITIHKAQGSQWSDVQVFAPDLRAAAHAGWQVAGSPLWKRLAYVAITRAQERLFWVVRNRLARPLRPLDTADLAVPAPRLELVRGAED